MNLPLSLAGMVEVMTQERKAPFDSRCTAAVNTPPSSAAFACGAGLGRPRGGIMMEVSRPPGQGRLLLIQNNVEQIFGFQKSGGPDGRSKLARTKWVLGRISWVHLREAQEAEHLVDVSQRSWLRTFLLNAS